MLLGTELPMSLWGEAVTTAAYLINRCPLTGKDFKTLMEVWSGKPANYSSLKVLGDLAYAHIKLDKLEPRVVKCVSIGFLEGVKGYKLWKLESGEGSKVLIGRDVTFDETRMVMKCKDLETLVPETRVEETQFEAELPNEEKDNVEDEASTSETSGTQPVVDPDYLLVRDREQRTITTPRRYGYADLVCYALNVLEDLQDS